MLFFLNIIANLLFKNLTETEQLLRPVHTLDPEAVRYGWTISDALERKRLLGIVAEKVVVGDLITVVTVKTLGLFVNQVCSVRAIIFATGILCYLFL